jgi:hypothetical protein
MFHSVRMKWLELSIVNNIQAEAAKQELISFAGSGYEFRTRNQAFLVLKSTYTFTNDVAKSLMQAMLSNNSRLASPAAELAAYFATNASYQAQFKDIFNKENYTKEERDILMKQAIFKD